MPPAENRMLSGARGRRPRNGGDRPQPRRVRGDAGRHRPCPGRRCAAAANPPPHLGRAPPRPRRLAGRADRPAHHLPDRRHHRPAGLLPFPQVRRRRLRGRHGRHPGAARDRRADRRHHGGRPLGQLLHGRARLDEDARGDRRPAHHGARPRRGADPAARPRARHRPADADLPRLDGGALRRRAGGLALRRHEPGDLHRAPAGRRSRSRISRSA